MGLMGWSQSAMAVRYQHLTAAIRRDVADQLGELLWSDVQNVGDRNRR